jgi:hypothetical protein
LQPANFDIMEYGKIISVTGLSGLFELLASKGDGAIVRSLEDKTTKFVSGRVHNFSHLESIEVYTERDNVNLVDIFQAMQQSAEPLPSEKDAAAVRAYFQAVYPTMDFGRVYGSDMKKMVKWFSVLQQNDVELKLSHGGEEPVEEEVSEATEAPAATEAQPEKAPKKAKAAVKTADEPAEAATKPAPKKRAPKKSAE